MTPEDKKEFSIDDPKCYKFLSNGNLPVAGINDTQEYLDTREAMKIMGMSDDEQTCKEREREGEGERERGEGGGGGREREGGKGKGERERGVEGGRWRERERERERE